MTFTRAKYRENRKEFGQLMVSEQMRDVTADAAGDIKALAAGFAPRSKGDGPHMADEFEVQREAGVVKISGNLRVKVVVFNENPAAAPNEFGTRRNQRHRMLARAGAVIGEFKDHGDG